MTPKPLRMRDTKLSTALLLLLATAVLAKIRWDPSGRSLAETPVLYNNSMYADKIIDVLDDHEFAVSMHAFRSLGFQVSGIGVIGANGTRRECPIPPVNFTNRIRRVSRKIVLVPVVDSDKSGRERVKLLLVNTKTCKHTYIYDDLARNHLIFTSDDASDDRFTIMVQSRDTCQTQDWCRLHFDPLFREIELLDFDFDFPVNRDVKIQHAKSPDDNRFAVQFIDNAGTLTVRLYDFSANRTGPLHVELFVIGNYRTKGTTLGKSFYDHLSMTRFEMTSQGLSYCWHAVRPDEDPNHVHCSRFHEDGTLMFNRTIVYPRVVRLFLVKTIPNGFVLFSSKYSCQFRTRGCDIVQVAVVTREFQPIECEGCEDVQLDSEPLGNELLRIKHRRYDTGCDEVGMASWRIQEDGDSLEVHYVCKRQLNIVHRAFSM